MYIKWIVCKVNRYKKLNFSEAQEKWVSISDSDGFIAQTGGWDLNDNYHACIISFWETKENMEAFMKYKHDEILKDSEQSNTYNEIFAEYFIRVFNMDGKAGNLREAVRNGNLLRIADCIVRPGRTEHFEKMQYEVWIPGMQESKGMLGGIFSKNENNNLRYLVSTFWDNIQKHSDYSENKLRVLREHADTANDIKEITGRKISIVNEWKIIKS